MPTEPEVTLVTPTGDRPLAFALCERWMSRQTFKGHTQWIVVDDGHEPTACTCQQTYVRRIRQLSEPKHTLNLNLMAAIPCVEADNILIVEDDDYYRPDYVATMLTWLGGAELVGQGRNVVWHVRSGAWYRNDNRSYCTLCMTGFRRSVLDTFADMCVRRKDPIIDHRLWRHWQGSKRIEVPSFGEPPLVIGVKGMPGRRGRTRAHNPRHQPYRAMRNGKTLQTWLGDDADAYKQVIQPLPHRI